MSAARKVASSSKGGGGNIHTPPGLVDEIKFNRLDRRIDSSFIHRLRDGGQVAVMQVIDDGVWNLGQLVIVRS